MVSEDQENAREGLILKVIYLSQKDASHNATTLFSENLAENNFQRKKMKASVIFYWRYSSIVVLVAQSCLTFCDPMDPPSSSVHGILQARILEWVAVPFAKRSSQLGDLTQVSCIAGRFFGDII